MRGMFKFVLSKDDVLYIGFSHNDYHQDICGDLRRNQVEAAGWIEYDKEDNSWFVNGKSIGYGISFMQEDADKIEAFLKDLTDDSVIELMDCNGRVQFSIN